jgi:drug/metabolite transporter (DMT)-like permease
MSPAAALVITNIIWGCAAPVFKFALTNIPPFTLAFIRFFFASFLFIPFILKVDFRKISFRDWLAILAGSFFGISINITFFFLGLKKADSINAPIIASTGPLFIFLFSIIFLKEKVKMQVLAGMIMAFLGALLIIFAPIIFKGQQAGSLGAFEGNLLLVIATLGYVLSPLFLKKVLKKVNPYLVSWSGFLFSSFTFLPFALGELRTWSFSQLDLAGITGIVYGVFFSSALAYFCFYYGLSKISAQEVGIFTYLDPVSAILVAAPLLNEYPDIYFIIGSVFVFGGVYIAENKICNHLVRKLLLVKSKIQSPNLPVGRQVSNQTQNLND